MAASENKALIAAQMFNAGDYEGAHALAQNLLRENPDDPDALFVVATCAAKADEYGTAIPLLRRAAELKPTQAEIWNNLGMAYEGVNRHEDGLKAFQRAHKIRANNPIYLANMGQSHLAMGKPQTAIEWCDKALHFDPLMKGALVTKGFAMLSQGHWSDGWAGYGAGLGGKFRMQQDYGVPVWRGEPDARVIVYFEQGLGDEILHATAVDELIKVADRVALDCDPRVVKLFRRSFPKAVCHATRRDEKHWLKPGDWTHQIAAGDLFAHFRPTWQSCPGKAFLTPSEDYRTMYRALLEKKAGGKKKVGLCWSGGNYLTNARHRRVTLEMMRGLIESHRDTCEFFSLEYNESAGIEVEQSGLPVHHFRYIVGLGADYEHTAAFISELDGTVGIHTAAHHAAGATGVPSMILVPENPSWLYQTYQGDRWCVYPQTARLFRRGPGERWDHTIERMVKGAEWKQFHRQIGEPAGHLEVAHG